MEKWLSQHCQIIVERREIRPGESLDLSETVVTIEYIDQRRLKISGGGASVYRIKDMTYLSPDLTKALQELKAIARFNDALR